jgi:hypothetical protein
MKLNKKELFYEFLKLTGAFDSEKGCLNVSLMEFAELAEDFAKKNTTCECENCQKFKDAL